MTLPLLACESGHARLGGCTGAPCEWSDSESRIRATFIARSPEAVHFTSVTSLAASSDGTVYVADWYEGRITVLTPQLELEAQLGRRGSGPGEFRGLRSVQVVRGDSLLIYDSGLGRISLYAARESRPAATYLYTSLVPGSRIPDELLRTGDNQHYVARFSRGHASHEDPASFAGRMDTLRVTRLDGSSAGIGQLALPAREFLTTRYRGEFSITPHPFGRRGHYATGSGAKVYTASSDSLRINIHDPRGASHVLALEYTPPLLSARDVQETTAGWGELGRQMFSSLLAERAPERWPAIGRLLIDDEENIWIQLAHTSNDSLTWIVYRKDGAFQGWLRFPRQADLRNIRNRLAYAAVTDSLDVPRVEVYSLTPPVRLQ